MNVRVALVAFVLVASASTIDVRADALVLALPSMVSIPGSTFTRGSTPSNLRASFSLCVQAHLERAGTLECHDGVFEEETPARRIRLSAYRIDRTEVTQAKYQRCVAAGRCVPSRTHAMDARVLGDELPVTGVTFDDAQAYCAFVSGRLPTEAEWEHAARGDEARRIFPWGAVFDERLANHGGLAGRPPDVDGARYLAPVGSYPGGRSPYGLDDMAGNVWEWTLDRFSPGSYADDLSVSPTGPESGMGRMVRGGSWRSSPVSLRVTSRLPVPEPEHSPDLGFRCVYDTHRP
jgi:formylglycine-generating enzyme required for sulfatase activity